MEVNEALSIQQRIKRANIAHRNANKLKVSRDRAARKLAPEGNIKKRAYALARKILRKRVAGGRGAVYQELGPTEKISIDKQLDNKKALIKKIALRLIPKIRQSEQHRLQSFLKGKAMKNDAINEAFEKKFKKKKKSPDSYIKFFNKFTEEKQNNTGAYRSLLKKSEKHGVDVEAIGDIYNEAFNDFENVETNLTPEQYAFSRVNHELNELSKDTYNKYTDAAYKSRQKEFMGRKNMVTMIKRKKGIESASRLSSKKVDEQTAYSQSELGKHVKTYKNVRGSKYDLYKNLNGHKLVNRISGASEDFPNHHVTRELHKKLLKTMLPEETQLDEVSPSRTVADVRGAQHNLANLRRGIKPEIKKAPTWKQHMASYDKEEKAKYHEHKKHYEFHKAELHDLHKTYKDLHSGNLGIHKDDKEGQHGAEEEIESMKDKHRAKMDHHLNKMHYHNSNLSKPLKIKESLDEASSKFRAPRDPWGPDVAWPDDARDPITKKLKKSLPGYKAHIKQHYPKSLWKQYGVKEDLDEGRYIVSGTHEDQGFSKTKVYKADSEEHARKQFHDEFEKFNARKIKKLTLNKVKNESYSVGYEDKLVGKFKSKKQALAAHAAEMESNGGQKRVTVHKNTQNKSGTWSHKLVKEDHPNCGTPECCGKCEPLDEFVLTAAAIASVAAAKKTKKVAPKVGNYVKKQAFSQAGHLKDKIAGIISKKEAPETRMSSKEYLKKREAMVKEETNLTDRIENLKEVLGPENQIGTKALVKKLQKATPGQEKAQVNEQFEKELIHHGVVLHRTNKERKTKAGGYSVDHKVIKWSKQYDINPNLKSFSGKGAGHAHQFAHQKAVRDHPEVKKHLKDGWSVDTFKIDPSKKPVLDHINNKLAYIKKQNGNLHLTEELDLGEACWKGYKQLGMKKKGDKTVPNCVKESDEQNFRKQHNLEKAKKSVRPNVWGSHVGYIGKKRYTTFPDNVAAKQWLGEDVKSAEVKGVIVPAYVDANGNTIPAKTIKRKQGNKILSTGNMQDGK